MKSLVRASQKPGVERKSHHNGLRFTRLVSVSARLGLVLGLVLGTAAVAQEETPAISVRQDVSAEEFETLRKLADDSEALNPDQKTTVANLCVQALKELKEIRAVAVAVKAIDDRMANIPIEATTAGKQLDDLKNNTKSSSSEYLPSARADLAGLRSQLQTLETDPLKFENVQRTDKKRTDADAIATYTQKILDVEKKLKAASADGENEIISRAQTMSQRVQQRWLTSQVELLKQRAEELSREDEVELPRLNRELVDALKVQIGKLEKQVENLTLAESQKDAEQATTALKMNPYPILQDAKTLNLEIANRTIAVAKDNTTAKNKLKAAEADLQDLANSLAEIRQNVKTIGLTKSIGLLLQKERSQLKSVSDVQKRMDDRSAVIEQAYPKYHRADKLYTQLQTEDEVQKILDAFVGQESDKAKFETAARETFDKQRDNLLSLVGAYNDYTNTLNTLDITDRTIVRRSAEFRQYIDERVLWIRSHPAVSPHGFVNDLGSTSRVHQLLAQVGQWVAKDFQNAAWYYGMVVILSIFVLYSATQLRSVSTRLGEEVRSRGFFRMTPTLRVLFMTAILSALWPAILLFFAWRFQTSSSLKIHNIANSLIQLAGLLLAMEFVRKACRSSGLCESHFDWPVATCSKVRAAIRQFMIVFLPLFVASHLLNAVRKEDESHALELFASDMLNAVQQDDETHSLERLCFSVAMMAVAFLFHKLLHPDKGAIRQLLVINKGGWFAQLRYLWYASALLIPLGFAVLALTGFFYTARVLVVNFQTTISLLLLLMFVREILARWLLVQSRRLRLEKLKERRESELKRLASAGEETTVPPIAVEEADVSSISEQTRRLMNTSVFVAILAGVWLIWFNLLPALKLLDQSPLWSTSTEVAEKFTNADGDVAVRMTSQIEAITIADVGLCLLILTLTFTATRNLPGLLEMSVLQRLPIDADVRYAIGRMVSYAIILVGLLAASRSIGLSWSNVQWLAAALTFGLAFGMQEIFANFVSGLIILIERPIRVGDVVTLDQVSGVVSRIRMRATTMTDWDRKEYIVPNKEFITGRLLNWTLTDTVNRVVVHVGVAYGSDTENVRQVLAKICRDNEYVLADPSPIVTFEAFGESTLNFAVRAYLPNLDNRLKTINDLHTEINRRFVAESIEIAFPQRDLNVRSMPDTMLK